MKQYVFYQHNVQQFFIRHLDKFDGVIAPLSIATSFPDGTHGFFQALFAKAPQKQFLIDPRSPLFQKGWNRSNVRPPHQKMAAVFGEPFTTHGLTTKIETAHLPEAKLKVITKACIEYQKQFRFRANEQKKLEKYKKLLGVAVMPQIANPQLFVPPYFRFESTEDAWYKASLGCINYAREHVDPVTLLRPVLHFENPGGIANWAPIVKQLKDWGISSVFLYPNNFQEPRATSESLKSYCGAVRAFAGGGIEPYALHGGYFAITLSKVGMLGFGNGIGYGEWRDSGYHQGGTAEKRIYVLKLHRFLEPARAQALVNSASDYFASDTDLLAECVASQRPIESVSLEEALDHFMDCRKQEISFVSANSAAAIAAEISKTIEILDGLGEVEKEYATSLKAWRGAMAGW